MILQVVGGLEGWESRDNLTNFHFRSYRIKWKIKLKTILKTWTVIKNKKFEKTKKNHLHFLCFFCSWTSTTKWRWQNGAFFLEWFRIFYYCSFLRNNKDSESQSGFYFQYYFLILCFVITITIYSIYDIQYYKKNLRCKFFKFRFQFFLFFIFLGYCTIPHPATI